MRMVGRIALASVALVAPAWSQDVYRWQDSSGQVHYSDTSAGSPGTARLSDQPLPYDATPPDAETADAPAPARGAAADAPPADDGLDAGQRAPSGPVPEDQVAGVSTNASLRRNELERDLRTTEKRIDAINSQLRALAAQRTRFAGGMDATGGVRTSAADVRSEEEKALEAERQELSQHAVEIRSAAVKLREETKTQLGSTPDWWVDVR